MKQRLTLSMCILAAASALNAQTDDQYRMEIGVMLCLYDKPLWMNERTIALLVEYV